MNKVINNIIMRRSCKSFQPDMVPDEIINQIVQAGLYAASGMGKQSPIILVVTNKKKRAKSFQSGASTLEWVLSFSPIIILIQYFSIIIFKNPIPYKPTLQIGK